MARQYYKDSTTGQMKPIGVKVEDTLPVGTIVEYNGQNIPEGWVQVDDPNEYSTNEKRIGTWIDGKPLYRKTLLFPNGNNGSLNIVEYNLSDYGIININEIFIVHPSYYSNSVSHSTYPFQYNDGSAFECNVNETKLKVKLGYQQISNSKFVITLEYTKTTD